MDLSELRKHVQGLAETLKMIDDLILERDKWRNEARLANATSRKQEEQIHNLADELDRLVKEKVDTALLFVKQEQEIENLKRAYDEDCSRRLS